jgi:hypothetical protein
VHSRCGLHLRFVMELRNASMVRFKCFAGNLMHSRAFCQLRVNLCRLRGPSGRAQAKATSASMARCTTAHEQEKCWQQKRYLSHITFGGTLNRKGCHRTRQKPYNRPILTDAGQRAFALVVGTAHYCVPCVSREMLLLSSLPQECFRLSCIRGRPRPNL